MHMLTVSGGDGELVESCPPVDTIYPPKVPRYPSPISPLASCIVVASWSVTRRRRSLAMGLGVAYRGCSKFLGSPALRRAEHAKGHYSPVLRTGNSLAAKMMPQAPVMLIGSRFGRRPHPWEGKPPANHQCRSGPPWHPGGVP